MSWQPELDELKRREAMAYEMGGADKVKRQHDGGRLTVRERIDRLVDKDSFHEVGALSGIGEYDAQNQLTTVTPANCVFGRAKVDGRPVVPLALPVERPVVRHPDHAAGRRARLDLLIVDVARQIGAQFLRDGRDLIGALLRRGEDRRQDASAVLHAVEFAHGPRTVQGQPGLGTLAMRSHQDGITH